MSLGANAGLLTFRLNQYDQFWRIGFFDSDNRDVEYYYESQLQNEPAPVADHHFHVFEPRTFRAYAEYRF